MRAMTHPPPARVLAPPPRPKPSLRTTLRTPSPTLSTAPVQSSIHPPVLVCSLPRPATTLVVLLLIPPASQAPLLQEFQMERK
jgi:hypothetical protein